MTSPGSVEGDERLRLFCALRLPDDVLDAFAAWQSEHLSDGTRIVPRDHLHVTLAFLGSTPADALDGVAEALDAAAGAAREIVFSTRRYRETRSVGMVVLDDETGASSALAEDVFARLEQLGVYRREQRPWLPHVTVLRFRTPPRLRPPDLGLPPFRPSDAAVYMSVLRPSGAQYEPLRTVALGG